MSVLSVFSEYTSILRSTGFRGLTFINSSDFDGTVVELLSNCNYDRILVVTSSELGSKLSKLICDSRVLIAKYSDVNRLLGSEYDVVIVAVTGSLRPNLVAAVGEMVKGGGVLVLLTPPLDKWNPGFIGGRGVYKDYLVHRISECKNLLWIDVDLRKVRSFNVLRNVRASYPPKPKDFKSRRGIPRTLLDLAINIDQAQLLEEFAGFIRGRARSFTVIGDRGRGKSALVGLALALTVYWRICGPVQVIAPDIYSVQSLMRMLVKGLNALNIKCKVVEVNGLIHRVQGSWFRVYYKSPSLAEPGPLIVLDEAAAIGIARARRLTWRSGKSILSTTVHGYEGSGRVFTNLLLSQLPKPLVVRELKSPVRYPPGDPLEEWIYTTFMLKAEPPEIRELEQPVEYVDLKPQLLSLKPELFSKAYSILVLAHYRNEPDDILLMLDAPHHELRGLTSRDNLVAVLEYSTELPEHPKAAKLVLNKLELYEPKLKNSMGLRIVRIAVIPQLQRRGLGSKLLKHFEEEAYSKGYEWIGSIFSRHDVLEFWLKNGYRVFYISPRYNRVTGEKNIAVIKALKTEVKTLVDSVVRVFKWRLLVSAHSIYRDLAAEKIALILKYCNVGFKPDIKLSLEQERRLEKYLSGELEFETVHDSVYLATLVKLAETVDYSMLSDRELTGIIARVIQGKPLDEVASILGVSVDEAHEIVDNAIKRILK